MSLKAFFENIFLKHETIQDILDLYPNPSEKGFKFERCCDLLIKLGFLPLFTNDKYKHVIGNVNEGKTHFYGYPGPFAKSALYWPDHRIQ
jgi:hypothetical protein